MDMVVSMSSCSAVDEAVLDALVACPKPRFDRTQRPARLSRLGHTRAWRGPQLDSHGIVPRASGQTAARPLGEAKARACRGLDGLLLSAPAAAME